MLFTCGLVVASMGFEADIPAGLSELVWWRRGRVEHTLAHSRLIGPSFRRLPPSLAERLSPVGQAFWIDLHPGQPLQTIR